MGSIPTRFVVEGRTIANFGEAFAALKDERLERFYLIQVREDRTLFDPYLLAQGETDRVKFDMIQVTRYITNFIDHGFVCLHNHPAPNRGGPSEADWNVTKNFVKIAKATNKIFYDHCVVSDIDYYFRTLIPEIFQCIP